MSDRWLKRVTWVLAAITYSLAFYGLVYGQVKEGGSLIIALVNTPFVLIGAGSLGWWIGGKLARKPEVEEVS